MILTKLWVLAILSVISIVDIKRRIIPDVCVLLLIPVTFFSVPLWQSKILASMSVWAVYVVTALIAAIAKTQVPIGMGDIKLLSAIGLISGYKGLLAATVLSSILGGITAATLLLLKKVQKKDQIAFGPFIAVSYALYLASVSAI